MVPKFICCFSSLGKTVSRENNDLAGICRQNSEAWEIQIMSRKLQITELIKQMWDYVPKLFFKSLIFTGINNIGKLS